MNIFKRYFSTPQTKRQQEANTRIAMNTMFASGLNTPAYNGKCKGPELNNAQKVATLQMMGGFYDE